MMQRTIAFAIVTVVALGALVVFANGWATNGKVARVVVRGTHLAATDDVLRAAAVAPGARAGDVDLAAVRRRVMALPLVRNAVVRRDAEGVVIEIDERVPVARLAGQAGWFLVDADGVALPVDESRLALDLPLIVGVQADPHAAQRDTTALHDAMTVLRAATDPNAGLAGAVSVVRRSPDGSFTIETTGTGTPVRFGSAAGAAAKVSLVRDMLPVLAQRGTPPTYVDVRFADQVVVRWPDSGNHE